MAFVSGTVKDDTGSPVAGRIVRAYRRDSGAMLGQAVTSDGSSPDGDEHWSSVVSLLSYDGSGFVDATGRGWVAHGFSASGIECGMVGRSGIFPFAASRITTESLNLSGPLTIETGYLHTSRSTLRCIFRSGDNYWEAWGVYVDEADKIRVYGNSGWLYTATHALVDGQIYRLEVGYSGSGDCLLFVDGTIVASVSSTTLFGTKSFHWGGDIYNQGLRSFLDNGRITVGVCRHVTSFTPLALGPLPQGPVGTMPAVGSYRIEVGSYAGEVQVVCLDDAGGVIYNDMIARATPV